MGVLFGIGGRDGALVGFFGDEIELVSGKSNDDVLVGLTLQLLDPSLCLVEGSLCGLLVEGRRLRVENGAYSLSDVVDYDGAVGVAVVHGSQGLVALLTCGIPDLELDGSRVIEGDCLGEESGADGGFPVVIELVLDETEDERTLWCVRLVVRESC